MEFEEPRAAACEVELLAHAHQTPSTTFVVGHFRPIQRGFAMSGLSAGSGHQVRWRL
jgi:hypothetical protein